MSVDNETVAWFSVGMNRSPLPASLAALVHVDHEWARCNACDDAFWGVANVTAVIRAKAERHAHKAHGFGQGRAERRGAAAQGLPADLDPMALATALATAFATVAASGVAPRELGHGVARRGFNIPNSPYIVKVAKSGCQDHNLAEYKAYTTAPAHLRRWLCPAVAVAPDGAWIIMRRAERVGRLGWTECHEVEDAIGDYVGDLHEGNIGIVDGHVVATDYAGGRWAVEVDWRHGR